MFLVKVFSWISCKIASAETPEKFQYLDGFSLLYSLLQHPSVDDIDLQILMSETLHHQLKR